MNEEIDECIQSRENALNAVVDRARRTEFEAVSTAASIWETSPLVQMHGSLPLVRRIGDILDYAPWLSTEQVSVISGMDHKAARAVVTIQDIMLIGKIAATIDASLTPNLFRFRKCRVALQRIPENGTDGMVYAECYQLDILIQFLSRAAHDATDSVRAMSDLLSYELEVKDDEIAEGREGEAESPREAIRRLIKRPAGSIGFSLSGTTTGYLRPHLETLRDLISVLEKQSDWK